MQAKSAAAICSKSPSKKVGKLPSQEEVKKQDQDFAELLASGNAGKPEAADAKLSGKKKNSTSLLFRKRIKGLMKLPSFRAAS